MNEKLNELIQKHFELKKQIDSVTEQDEQIKAEIKMIMSELGEDVYENENGELVSYKESQRKSLDRKMVEQKLAPEVFNECFKVSAFSVLRILSKEDRERVKSFVKK